MRRGGRLGGGRKRGMGRGMSDWGWDGMVGVFEAGVVLR